MILSHLLKQILNFHIKEILHIKKYTYYFHSIDSHYLFNNIKNKETLWNIFLSKIINGLNKFEFKRI